MSGDCAVRKDLVIIGAGLYGIQAARTYLEVHSNHDIAVLEAGTVVGGVWSSERVYDAFWTQTPLDIAEFSDRPMDYVPPEDQYYRFFAAKYVTQYLQGYVKDHIYNGATLLSRIHFQAPVTELTKADGLWHVYVRKQNIVYKTPRVIDASGLTSSPYIPLIDGVDSFEGPVIHHLDFARSNILADPHIKNIAVIGGAKSAADVAYAAAKAKKNVNWIIRKSGSGPGAFFGAKGPVKYRNSNEAFYTRLTSSFIASIFVACPPRLRWIYVTTIGQMAFNKFWNGINDGCLKAANYDRKDGRSRGFDNLKPDSPVFWQNDSSGVNQHDDFFDIIAKGVTIHRQDIVSLEDKWQLRLADGTSVPVDGIICATGWSNSHSYLNVSMKAKLGLPAPKTEFEKKELDSWDELEQQADEQLLKEFPILFKPPKGHENTEAKIRSLPETPYRLYNGMLPVEDPSIVFLGHVMLGNHFRASEVQALWATAVMDNRIDVPLPEEMRASVAKTVQWCRRRYLVKGSSGNWFYYDMLPYTDMLLHQIGLKSHLKGSLMSFAEPAWARDLKDLITEYRSTEQAERD